MLISHRAERQCAHDGVCAAIGQRHRLTHATGETHAVAKGRKRCLVGRPKSVVTHRVVWICQWYRGSLNGNVWQGERSEAS
jgi:hypothetical protein